MTPDRCLHCGSRKLGAEPDYGYPAYDCGTAVILMADAGALAKTLRRSNDCYERELAALRAEREVFIDALRGAAVLAQCLANAKTEQWADEGSAGPDWGEVFMANNDNVMRIKDALGRVGDGTRTQPREECLNCQDPQPK